MPVTAGKPGDKDTSLDSRDEQFRDRIFTVPNVICMGRSLGAIVMLGFAFAGCFVPFVFLFIFLSLTDLIDGLLARWLHQRSDLGARLDTLADVTLYACLIGGASILCWDQLQHEWIWLAIAVGSYALSVGTGLWKYGRIPSYHTCAAKITNWLAMLAAASLLFGWSIWPLRIAGIAVTLTNLEATAITCTLKEWQADVLTLLNVWPNPGRNGRAARKSQAVKHD